MSMTFWWFSLCDTKNKFHINEVIHVPNSDLNFGLRSFHILLKKSAIILNFWFLQCQNSSTDTTSESILKVFRWKKKIIPWHFGYFSKKRFSINFKMSILIIIILKFLWSFIIINKLRINLLTSANTRICQKFITQLMSFI